ncbi:MAG: hypothetical protein IJ410_08775 [Oscillospiraceae bacterium]|nr:hypothetical protein [Oscillospiraceae bacterium]
MNEKFVPLEKQSKKAQKRAAAAKRGSWYGVKPVTKVVQENKKDKLEKIKKKEVNDYR